MTAIGPITGTPSTELDYAQVTGNATIANITTDATAQAVVTGAAVTYDGITRILLEFYACAVIPISPTNVSTLILRDGGTSLGNFGIVTAGRAPVLLRRFLTPSAGSHTYSVALFNDAAGSSFINAGAGTAAGTFAPMYLRITRA